jgi:singapore isolate B (sub-type 7) whole genome shotgun sequence assembly, scaffold_2
MIEQHNDEYIRINFDITMTKLSCEYATLDVVNQMGTHKARVWVVFITQINVTQNIRRWQVYSNGFSREITPGICNSEDTR